MIDRNARAIVRSLMPPIVLAAWRRLQRRLRGASGEKFLSNDWPGTATESGWADESIVRAQSAKWKEFLRLTEGTTPLGINHEAVPLSVADYDAHNMVMSFAYALALANGGRPTMSILDWGCGIGHYAAFTRAVLPDVRIAYTGFDLPGLCEAGRRLNPEVRFTSEPEDWRGLRYDLVLASGSMQYSRDWRGVVRELATATGRYLFLTRVNAVERVPSFVVAQRPADIGYRTTLTYWALNETELLREARARGVELLREFALQPLEPVSGAPEQPVSKGYLFRVRDITDQRHES